MMVLSPQFSTVGWHLEEDPIGHHEQYQHDFLISGEGLNFIHQNCNDDSPAPVIQLAKINSFPKGLHDQQQGDDEPANKVAMKLNHNASERDRRKRINTLYSTLRSLLPRDDQSKKLSIPGTVSSVVKYIPELQKEVERLVQEKENLLTSKISGQQEDLSIDYVNKLQRKSAFQSSVSVSPVGDQEIVLQISMPKDETGNSFSGALTQLEMESFIVLNASCFQTFQGRVFCSLHLQAQGRRVKDAEMLQDKIRDYFFEKAEGILVT